MRTVDIVGVNSCRKKRKEKKIVKFQWHHNRENNLLNMNKKHDKNEGKYYAIL